MAVALLPTLLWPGDTPWVNDEPRLIASAWHANQAGELAPVPYAENDAREFTQAWQMLGVAAADCVLLVNQQATLTAVRSRLRRFLSNVQNGERIVLFYAGLGISVGEVGYLTTYDTLADDLGNTSLPLAELLLAVRQTPAREVVLFIDGSHPGLPVGAEEFTGDALLMGSRTTHREYIFTPCAAHEQSHSSHTLKHGIGTYCVLQALRGLAPSALTTEIWLTVTSLQNYLREEVPRLLRETRAGTVSQTPRMIGSASDDVVLADVGEILRNRQPAEGNALSFVQDATLAGEIRGLVRELRGYQKPKTPLATHNSWEQAFVEKAGESEVSQQATELFEQIRRSFGYKRKELSFACEGSQASIKTRDFDVNLALTQDTHAADCYVLRTEVAAFRRPAVVDDEMFLQIFSQYCDRVVVELKASVDIQAKIDEIEELESPQLSLTYDPAGTTFTLQMRETGIVIEATADRMIFSLTGKRDLAQLVRHTHRAVAQLARDHIALGLPGA